MFMKKDELHKPTPNLLWQLNLAAIFMKIHKEIKYPLGF